MEPIPDKPPMKEWIEEIRQKMLARKKAIQQGEIITKDDKP